MYQDATRGSVSKYTQDTPHDLLSRWWRSDLVTSACSSRRVPCMCCFFFSFMHRTSHPKLTACDQKGWKKRLTTLRRRYAAVYSFRQMSDACRRSNTVTLLPSSLSLSLSPPRTPLEDPTVNNQNKGAKKERNRRAKDERTFGRACPNGAINVAHPPHPHRERERERAREVLPLTEI